MELQDKITCGIKAGRPIDSSLVNLVNLGTEFNGLRANIIHLAMYTDDTHMQELGDVIYFNVLCNLHKAIDRR